MKTKSILVIAIALIASVAFANGPGNPKLSVVNVKDAGIFKVIYENPASEKIRMTITDADGKTLFNESVKIATGFVRAVNFKGMTPGEYKIEITDNKAIYTETVHYSLASTVKGVHVAKLNNANDKYLLSIANEGTEQVNVRIFDGSNNVIHDQNLAVVGDLGLVYNLKAVIGNPTFEVTDQSGRVKTIRY
jgi:hypothetical protein